MVNISTTLVIERSQQFVPSPLGDCVAILKLQRCWESEKHICVEINNVIPKFASTMSKVGQEHVHFNLSPNYDTVSRGGTGQARMGWLLNDE